MMGGRWMKYKREREREERFRTEEKRGSIDIARREGRRKEK